MDHVGGVVGICGVVESLSHVGAVVGTCDVVDSLSHVGTGVGVVCWIAVADPHHGYHDANAHPHGRPSAQL